MVFESEGGNFFRMILPDRKFRFHLIPNGLYCFDATEQENSIFLINTVAENREGFTRQGYVEAQEARWAMQLLGFPLERDFRNMICSNMILNCSVTFEDVKNAKLIFGTNFTSLRGKLVRRKPASVVTNYVEIPP